MSGVHKCAIKTAPSFHLWCWEKEGREGQDWLRLSPIMQIPRAHTGHALLSFRTIVSSEGAFPSDFYERLKGRFLQRSLVLKGGELEPARMGRLHSTQELWGGVRMKMEALGTNRTLFSLLSWGLFVQLSLALPSPVLPWSLFQSFPLCLSYCRSADCVCSDLPFLVQYCH